MAIDEDSFNLNMKPKRKRGSSGLANLQKARLKKSLRKERLKNKILLRHSIKQQNGSEFNPEKSFPEETASSKSSGDDLQSDYFLGNRELKPAEKLIIPLRLTTLTNRLHDGSKLCKTPPTDINDTTAFPTFNIIQNIGGLEDTNPVEWTPQQTFSFIRHISPVKGVAKLLRSEEVDGEAMLNLTRSDLISLHLDQKTSNALISIFSQLRREIIKRFVNI